MSQEKKMDRSGYGNLVKELPSYGELILASQKEKQAVMDGFDKEVKLFRNGKVSRKALASTMQKNNVILQKLDNAIKSHIESTDKFCKRISEFAQKQSPNKFKATMLGVRSAAPKKKVKKKAKKKKR